VELHQLRCFVTLAEESDHSDAAKRLGVERDTVSSAIRQLERELHVTLFVRDSRPVEVTPAGAALLTEARALLTHADNLMRVAASHQPLDGRFLVLGLFLGATAAAELTYPIIHAFQRQHGHVDVKVVPLDLTHWAPTLIHGLVDAALVPGPFGHHEVDVVPLYEEPRVITLSAGHALAEAGRITLSDLQILQREPWSSRGNQPRQFHKFFLLGDVWDVADLQKSGPARGTLSELVDDLVGGRFVGSMPLSLARQLPPNKVASLEVVGLQGVTIGVARRPGGVNPVVEAFVESARHTTRRLLPLVPGATLIP